MLDHHRILELTFTGSVIPITEPPVVEIDTEATAAYIRLRETKTVRTESFSSESGSGRRMTGS